MFVVSVNSKYGFCRYGKTFDKIHFTNIGENSQECTKERYCDKRHPVRCYFFDKYGRCKVGNCSVHIFIKKPEKYCIIKYVAKLKREISDLTHENLKLKDELNKITESNKEHFYNDGVKDFNMDLETLI